MHSETLYVHKLRHTWVKCSNPRLVDYAMITWFNYLVPESVLRIQLRAPPSLRSGLEAGFQLTRDLE